MSAAYGYRARETIKGSEPSDGQVNRRRIPAGSIPAHKRIRKLAGGNRWHDRHLVVATHVSDSHIQIAALLDVLALVQCADRTWYRGSPTCQTGRIVVKPN